MAEQRNANKGEGKSGGGENAAAQAPDPKPTTETQREDGRYEVDYLIANSASLLGSRPAIVAGALAQEERKTHTLEQARELLTKFQKREHDPNEGIA